MEIVDAPQNGLKGLVHWRQDLLAGLVVSLISVSFNLAIALASGAPPIAGMLSGIVAGLLVPFLGGSYVTICSCAAGLAPALYAGIMTLGHGKPEVGYPILLCCILFVGLIQMVMGKLKLARTFMIFPNSMIHGMLAAIGLGIVVKQIPLLLGVKFEGHGFFGILAEVPSRLHEANPQVVLISAVSLVTVFGIAAFGSDDKNAAKWKKYMPIVAPIATAAAALALSVGLKLDESFRVKLPNGLLSGITHPNFSGLMADKTIWADAVALVFVLLLINAGESLATVAAIDKKDPYGRRSEANTTLFAVGAATIASASVGGLTIIPGGIKSTANIVAGGRTQWANFWNAAFLVAYCMFLYSIINLLPLGGLAAIVCLMGWKLAKPSVWMHTWKVGKEQMLVFATTVAATLIHDLLWGIIAGIVVKLIVVLVLAKRHPEGRKLSIWQIVKQCFSNPVKEVDAGISYKEDGDYEIVLNGPVTCFNSRYLQAAFERIPKDVKLVIVVCEPNTMLVLDHTSAENLYSFKEYFERGRGIVDLSRIHEGMNTMSEHAMSLRTPSLLPIDAAMRD